MDSSRGEVGEWDVKEREGECRGKCRDPEGDGSETRRQKFTISHAIAPTKCHSRRQLEQQQRQQEAWGVQWGAGGRGGKQSSASHRRRQSENRHILQRRRRRGCTRACLCVCYVPHVRQMWQWFASRCGIKNKTPAASQGRGQPGSSSRRRRKLDVGQSYAPPVFMTHMRRSGLGPKWREQSGEETFTYIHTHTYASEYHNKQRDRRVGRGGGVCLGSTWSWSGSGSLSLSPNDSPCLLLSLIGHKI